MFSWRWAGARSLGTSHIKAGIECQDFLACVEWQSAAGNVLVAVVSDGAGSASQAETGSRIVCFGLLRAVRDHFRNGRGIDDADDETVRDWIDSIRERISISASRNQFRRRDYAATLVAVLAGPRSAIVLHIGDGAAVVREHGSSSWIVPSWPFHGEYASTTAFVTDDPAPRLSIERLPVRIEHIAVFSDGLERLVLDHAQRTAFPPFFNRTLSPILASNVLGHDRSLSRALRSYLDSEAICDRTDDDKALILGART
jgi:Protein phosphatase 2C